MQHNLNRGLPLMLSCMLLLGTLSACNRVPKTEPVAASDNSVNGVVADVVASNESEDSDEISHKAAISAVAGSGGTNRHAAKSATKRESVRPQIDVPPPPLGIVPVSSVRRTGDRTVVNDAEDPFTPPAPTQIRTAHRTERPISISSGRGQDGRSVQGSQPKVTHSRVSFSPTRHLTPGEQASVAERRQRLKEQENQAQKLVQERAAQQAQLRQARLSVRRSEKSRDFAMRGSTQLARTQPNHALLLWPVMAGNAGSR
jgi:hypothetical protein